MAIVAAIKTIKIPKTKTKVVVHTDLEFLSKQLQPKIHSDTKKQLNSELNRLNVSITFIEKPIRTDLYRWCHQMARFRAGCSEFVHLDESIKSFMREHSEI